MIGYSDAAIIAMQLRSKAITIVVLTTTILVALLAATYQLVVERQFSQLEEADVIDRADLVEESINQSCAQLDHIVADWSFWQDVYDYLETPNQQWFEDNVNSTWMRASAVSVCALIDAHGNIIGQRAFDLRHDQFSTVPMELANVLSAPSILTRMTKPTDHVVGLLHLSEGTLMVAARPSLDNDGNGPVHGVVVFGRWLDRVELEVISKRIRAPVTIEPDIGGDERSAQARASVAAGTRVAVIDDHQQTVSGYFSIPDIFNRASVMVRVDRPRTVMAAGHRTTLFLLIATAVSTLLFGGILLLALDRTVVARVTRLGHEVDIVGQGASNFTVIGDDEIARLAAAVQRMHTALAEANHAIGEARDQAITNTRAKADFLAAVSHEVRTPMNGVLGMTRLLLNTPLTDEQRELVEVLRSSGDSLLVLVNDILDMSKIEAGKLELEAVVFSPAAVVEEAVVLLAERAQAKGLELAAVVNHDVPHVVRGDPGRMRQIIVNLVANAVKFTERGDVVVRVHSVPPDANSDRNGERLRIVVSDTGIGIPAGARDRLFERYAQAESSTFRRFGGTGLGLSICKHLAERMNGSIAVESIAGQGSTFTVIIQLKRCEGPSGKVPLLPDSDVLSKRRVLLIDSHAATREAMQLMLRESGVELDEAADLPGAGLLLETSRRYQAVIVELALLGGGVPTTEQLELRLPRLAGIPMILLLPLAAKDRAAVAAGFAASISKPVRATQLRAALMRVIGAGTAATVAANDLSPTIGMHVLVVDDSTINCRVATGMLGRMGCRCDTATNGEEALLAMSKLDYDVVLLDCQMPVMDGYTAVTELRRREGARIHTRVVALTADATQGARERCLAAGMDDYLVKPVQYDDLVAAMRRARPSFKAMTFQGVAALPATVAEPVELDVELLDQVRVLGDEGFRSVLDRYIDQGLQRIEDMRLALSTGDFKKAGVIAHQLVGESGLVGLRRVEALARTIELSARGQASVGDDQIEQLRKTFARGADLLREVRSKPSG